MVVAIGYHHYGRSVGRGKGVIGNKGCSRMSFATKTLSLVLLVLIGYSIHLFFSQYNDVDRFQKKAIRIAEEKKAGHLYASRDLEKLQKVSDDCPEWVKQSPFTIAIGLWIEMIKNLVTLFLSFVTALFMYLMYKKDKGEVVEVEVIE